MSLSENALVNKLSLRHQASPEAVRAALDALRRSGGTMAQFSHSEFGGMAQWSHGMTMVGDMFNSDMKTRLDAICTELAAHLAKDSSAAPHDNHRRDEDVSYRASPPSSASWWPGDLGAPGATGTQNDMRYAVFPSSRRLAIDDGGLVTIYDTGEHDISGASQSQSTDRTLTFTSQNGPVKVSDLAKASG